MNLLLGSTRITKMKKNNASLLISLLILRDSMPKKNPCTCIVLCKYIGFKRNTFKLPERVVIDRQKFCIATTMLGLH